MQYNILEFDKKIKPFQGLQRFFVYSTVKLPGIADILTEFDVEIVGTGLVIVTTEPERKTIPEYSALLYLAGIDTEKKELKVFPNIQFF